MAKHTPISEIEGRPPDKPHLAFYTDTSGLATAVPPGAVIAAVIDPHRPDKVMRLVLLEVQRGKWSFACGCGSPHCNVKVTARLTQTGSH